MKNWVTLIKTYYSICSSLCWINVREIDLPAGDMGQISGHPKLYSGLAICTSDKKSDQIDWAQKKESQR